MSLCSGRGSEWQVGQERSLVARIGAAADAIGQLKPAWREGEIAAALMRSAEILGLAHHLSPGDRVTVHGRDGRSAHAELVLLQGGSAHVTMFESVEGLVIGGRVSATVGGVSAGLAISDAWLGRVVDPLGQPLDGGPPLKGGAYRRTVRGTPPPATRRTRLGDRLSLGVRALDLFATCRRGQRIGVFSGSGVGKSTLLGMLARNVACDITVIALVGERGREVREFLEENLGPAGLTRSVVVVATSDTNPMMRREAAYAAMTIAEYFRDRGKQVLFLMDSITRLCQALREIATLAGEPPASRGYPPSVFAELPCLLERAGPGPDGADGQVTAFFTVLVEGDDHNEPIADSVRGLLDGHVVLSRRIAEQGRYPAIDIGSTLSRSAPGCNSPAESALATKARRILSVHTEVADLVRLGAYRAGADPVADEALSAAPCIEALLRQDCDERTSVDAAFARLALALDRGEV